MWGMKYYCICFRNVSLQNSLVWKPLEFQGDTLEVNGIEEFVKKLLNASSLGGMQAKVKQEWDVIAAVTLEAIWKARNNVVFRKCPFHQKRL